jgi:hypothetical protein
MDFFSLVSTPVQSHWTIPLRCHPELVLFPYIQTGIKTSFDTVQKRLLFGLFEFVSLQIRNSRFQRPDIMETTAETNRIKRKFGKCCGHAVHHITSS